MPPRRRKFTHMDKTRSIEASRYSRLMETALYKGRFFRLSGRSFGQSKPFIIKGTIFLFFSIAYSISMRSQSSSLTHLSKPPCGSTSKKLELSSMALYNLTLNFPERSS